MSPSTTGIVPGFLSTPSGWRATSSCTPAHSRRPYFYPRPPGGGRRLPRGCPPENCDKFLSTPSGWRATANRFCAKSLHTEFLSTPSGWRATALCSARCFAEMNFYPRPPGGGRRDSDHPRKLKAYHFYPRPPGGGRLRSEMKVVEARYISIHALRVEGDPTMSAISLNRSRLFLSTPSGWRATDLILFAARYAAISIHALRVEGDTKSAVAIHWNRKDFYPRPPGGGRH